VNVDKIVAELKRERERLDRAIAALDVAESPGGRKRSLKQQATKRRDVHRSSKSTAAKKLAAVGRSGGSNIIYQPDYKSPFKAPKTK